MRVNSGYVSQDACAVPTVDAATGLPRLFENRASGGTEYCSHDAASWPDGGSDHIFLGVQPLMPDATFPTLAAYRTRTRWAGGTRTVPRRR